MKIVGKSFALLLLFSPIFLIAQTASKSEKAVHSLQESGFLETYKDYRSETEKYAALFKARKEEYSPEEMITMRNSYERTAEAFEDFILMVRNDLLDKKKRKNIRKNTEGYVVEKLEKLNDIYMDHYLGRFIPTYSAIVEDPDTYASHFQRFSGNGNIPVALIAPATQATLNLIEFFDKKNDRDIVYLKDLLEKDWVTPNRFTSWKDI